MNPKLTQGEVIDQILDNLKELVPGLDPTQIQADEALLPQLDLPHDEFQKLQGMIYDDYGIHLRAEKFSASITLMEIVQAVLSHS